MRNLKWIGAATLATGMAFALGGCVNWTTLAAGLVGWSLWNSLTQTT